MHAAEDFWTTAASVSVSGNTESPGSGSSVSAVAKLNTFDYMRFIIELFEQIYIDVLPITIVFLIILSGFATINIE